MSKLKVAKGTDLLSTITNAVDELGTIKAQIADLEERENELRQLLVDMAVPEVEGKLFRATVVTTEVTNVKWKEVVEALPPSATKTRLVNKFTEVKDRTTVKVVAR